MGGVRIVNEAWLSAVISLFCKRSGLVQVLVGVTTLWVRAWLTRVKSSRILNAPEVYLVQGLYRGYTCSMYGVDNRYFDTESAMSTDIDGSEDDCRYWRNTGRKT